MLVTINEGSANIHVDFEAAIHVDLEPGIWVAQHRGTEYAITELRGRLIAGALHLAYPRGVPRKANGHWSSQQRILPDVLPLDNAKAWKQLPPRVRDCVDDAYLLAVHELPQQVVLP